MNITTEDIGIAILSTDRPHCLERLLESIDKYSPDNLPVYVIDDSSEPIETKEICDKHPRVFFLQTGDRIGIAANTNFAMWALSDRKYKMIMNNDVEVLSFGWENYYFDTMKQTDIHHFCFQQEGLWGAATNKRPQEIQEINGKQIKTIRNHPQGAILTYDQLAFDTVGYFDAEKFQSYGKSHWMWSFSVSESGIQPKGIHDVIGSNDFFKVHNEESVTSQKERLTSYQRNTKIFNEELQKLKSGTRSVYTERQ